MLPDMTLYSFVTVRHRLDGSSCGAQVSYDLFGNSHAGLRHDFPSHLDQFCRRTGSMFGHAEDVALQATVLPYFLRFRPIMVQTEAVALMRGETVESLKFVLGLPAGPSRARMPFCSCPECVRVDIEAYGYAYWHRRHQLPGVFVCPNHGSPILRSSIRINGRGLSILFLPDDPEIANSSASAITASQLSTLHRLASLSAEVLDRPLPGGYEPHVLRNTYLHGLKQLGLLTQRGYVRTREFIKMIHDRYHCIATLEPFDRIIGQSCVDGMLRLVRKQRGHFHSACHILLIDALFGDWAMFTSVYAWEQTLSPPLLLPGQSTSRDTHISNENEQLATELASQYRNGQGSLSKLAKELGIGLQTAMRWMGKLGLISVTRRPKILTQNIRNEVIQTIKRGEAFVNISRSFSLSRSTIDRICNEQPNLQEEWRTASREMKRRAMRGKFEQLMDRNPDMTLSDLRHISDSGYSWLARHDRDWLKMKIPNVRAPDGKKIFRKRARVDWVARDHECLAALKAILPTLRFDNWERIQPMPLLRKLPKLSFSPRLDRLPESRALVEEILEAARIKRVA
jgi:hypothetical protein